MPTSYFKGSKILCESFLSLILTQFLKLVLLKQIWPLGHESESVIRHDGEWTISFFRYLRKSATQHRTTSAELGKEQFMRLLPSTSYFLQADVEQRCMYMCGIIPQLMVIQNFLGSLRLEHLTYWSERNIG